MSKMKTKHLRALVDDASPGPWGGWWGSSKVTSTNGETVVLETGEGPRQVYNDRLICMAPELASEVIRLREALKKIGKPACTATVEGLAKTALAALKEGQ